MVTLRRALLFILLTLALVGAGSETPWFRLDADGEPRVRLLVFHASTCPHCRRALEDLTALEAALPWLEVETYEVSASAKNAALYARIAGQLGEDARYVPAFAFCSTLWHGYDDLATTGRALKEALQRCHDAIRAPSANNPVTALGEGVSASPIHLPLVGVVDPEAISLPVLTVTLAALDAFNPCAFFVLLFLLSLLVHAATRTRMLLIGGLFVVVSGLVYFLFMAAWLNLFALIGHLTWVTTAAGLLALVIGGLNVKDFVAFGAGPSLSIPEQRKPGLYARLRGLVATQNLIPMLLGTVTLAILVNIYELLCTAGFPMVYTRALTLQVSDALAGYLWLGLYNLVYVLPMLTIVVGFAWTLGSRRLSERGGRLLKFLSGLMMLGLGCVLVTAPTALDRPVTALALVAGALVLTLIGDLWIRRKKHRATSAW